MKRLLYTLFILLVSTAVVWATHNRAGEITYEQLGENSFTYRVTIVTYTYSPSAADRESLTVFWGDNSSSEVPRVNKISLPDEYQRNVYVYNHTFPGTGTYEIYMSDQNRNANIANIDGSVNIPFTIKCQLKINADIGFNNAPILFTEPLDKAAVGHLFIHNAAAYDVDGDSLSYKLVTCLGANRQPIPNYRLPESSNAPITVNPVTGDLIWDAPTQVGNYNIAFLIEEWRDGIQIGQVLRDMQIEVVNTDNNPPVINPLSDVCVEAGKTLEFNVLATDADNDDIILKAYGGPLEDPYSKASFAIDEFASKPGQTVGQFKWNTVCQQSRLTPYQMEFKAEDNPYDPDPNTRPVELVDFKGLFITVVAPAPEITQLTPTNNSIEINWSSTACPESKMLGYKVYRKTGQSDFMPTACQTGVPAGYGFKLIANVPVSEPTHLLDNDNGEGLKQGHWYCYRIVAYFKDGSESFASEEKCERLVQGVPVMTNVDVLTTDTQTGQIYIAWVKPTEHSVVDYPGPYSYKIYRANGIWGTNFALIAELNGIDNTEYTDTKLNTHDQAYNYKVEFYSGTTLVSPPQTASSVFIEVNSRNFIDIKINSNVPWINTKYTIYRRLANSSDPAFELLGETDATTYRDKDVIHNNEYCYYTEAHGYYTVEGIKAPIENTSQEHCAIFVDNEPPCIPTLDVSSNCETRTNTLNWEITDPECIDDVAGFELYYSPTINGTPELLTTITDPEQRTWDHQVTLSVSGCYTILAYDHWSNRSELSSAACIDLCSSYVLPNIFTPDGNNINDLYHPILPYLGVERVEFQIFNRWGVLLFKTEDPMLNWNGTNSSNNARVTDGTYYYTCTVYELRLSGIEDRHLAGFIEVRTNKNTNPN